ncbi:putative kelch domain-containing protein [Diplogelasinospora grovesii]|uniref:Kelch domain-containing protein n=1 Tax=Diplogelasinospora grovesii TaxID=303347 RepID=A0AAN6RY96_9PEZI|nr:putative kelch domain-containing protein [Diplogelasinospora grovesii]
MAEIAAGALVAEQVVATGVEAAAAVAIARPTQPLRASLTRVAKASTEDTSLDLARSHHTVTVIGNKAHIFGGQRPDGTLCSTDVHAIALSADGEVGAQYACYPAFPLQDAATGEIQVPAPRSRHAACARGKFVVIHGGCDGSGTPVEEDACLWLWDSESLKWTKVRGETQIGTILSSRHDHNIFVDEQQDMLLLHGGRVRSGSDGDCSPVTTETWLYDFNALAWTTLLPSPAPAMNAAFTDTTLFIVSQDGDSSGKSMSGAVHYLRLGTSATEREKPDALLWQTVSFPINPLTPGPQPRMGGAFKPVSTGLGRNYLVYLFGCEAGGSNDEKQSLYSDIWSLQLPAHGLTAAAAKDAIRDRLPGMGSGEFSWAEVEIVPTEQTEHEGKVHPGPTAFFGADACLDGKGVVLWGGLNAKGEKEADGWMLRVL